MKNLQILDASFHRNGISGLPFYVALVDDPENDDVKLIIMFEAEGHTAVLSLDKLTNEEDISFGSNSWKGDQYEEVLKPELWSTPEDDEEDL